jgi:hypothetical protein
MSTVAALFVEKDGVYFAQSGIDPWDVDRDARTYTGPHKVIAHPPCQRWGRFWHGSPSNPHQFRLGEDQGCFAAALTAVRNYGGILEHPKDSKAWAYFGLTIPPTAGGWVQADAYGGFTCCVEQGFYGHVSNKPTWLYSVGNALPQLQWGKGPQRINEEYAQRVGYEKARRQGVMGLIGGKHKTRIRNSTPPEFRDLLVSMVTA